jgi:hypothetical protein
MNFHDELFDAPNPLSKTTQRKLCSTTLLIDDGDDSEAIDDEDSLQWMDKLRDVVGEEHFGLPEADVDLDALELEKILADVP